MPPKPPRRVILHKMTMDEGFQLPPIQTIAMFNRMDTNTSSMKSRPASANAYQNINIEINSPAPMNFTFKRIVVTPKKAEDEDEVR